MITKIIIISIAASTVVFFSISGAVFCFDNIRGFADSKISLRNKVLSFLVGGPIVWVFLPFVLVAMTLEKTIKKLLSP